jgi:hypothetical protein
MALAGLVAGIGSNTRSKEGNWQQGFREEARRQKGKPEVQFSPRPHVALRESDDLSMHHEYRCRTLNRN